MTARALLHAPFLWPHGVDVFSPWGVLFGIPPGEGGFAVYLTFFVKAVGRGCQARCCFTQAV